MQTTIKIFGGLKTLAGTDEVILELPNGATVAKLLEAFPWVDADTALVVAVNREYADRSTVVNPGDEVALIPPVSGGGDDVAGRPTIRVELTREPLDQAQLTESVIDPRVGAVVTFIGITREVPALEYEAYTEMAQQEITEIAKAAVLRHGLLRVAVMHRYGTVKLSEASVVIAVSAAHRAEAFAGARELIDELKTRAPIWKREEGEWLAGHLPSPRP